jgi:hypothetical protein
MNICAAVLRFCTEPKALQMRSREVSSMAEDRNVKTEDLDNWKPANGSEDGCGIDCARDEEENDCCSCCW